MKELSFKIQGEFVCHLARSWFWEEAANMKNAKNFSFPVL